MEPAPALVRTQPLEPLPLSTVPTQTWDNRTVHIMSNDPVSETPSAPEISSAPASEAPAEPVENFADMLRDFERSHSHKSEPGARQLQGTVISISADQVFLDIGYKTEGVLPRSAFENNAEAVKPGDTIPRLRHRPQRRALLRALPL